MHLKKEDVLKETLEYLKVNSTCSLDIIQRYFFNLLQERNLVGTVVNGSTTHHGVAMPQDDVMLINEVIFDLIVDRVLTPGANQHQLGLPHFTVTNKEKLNLKLEELS
ncbi:hypothetical protein D3C87_1439830 [compost metagenome]